MIYVLPRKYFSIEIIEKINKKKSLLQVLDMEI
jgi:hypothetical protein